MQRYKSIASPESMGYKMVNWALKAGLVIGLREIHLGIQKRLGAQLAISPS